MRDVVPQVGDDDGDTVKDGIFAETLAVGTDQDAFRD